MTKHDATFRAVAKHLGYESEAHMFENFGQWIWDYGCDELKDKTFSDLFNQFISLNTRKKCNK